MGVGVSAWRLARAVSRAGQLGVVSGTGLDLVLTRRLQLGDPGGHIRRALDLLPISGIAERILQRYYIPGGKAMDQPFRSKPQPAVEPSRLLEELLVVSNFVEVFLAKEGHDGLVGINYLEKIQLPLLPSVYGAMLAGVDFVLMGAGIPKSVPGILDRLSQGEPVRQKLNVEGAGRGRILDPLRSSGIFLRPGVQVGKAEVLSHYLLRDPRHDAGTTVRRSSRRLCRRRLDGRRAQRTAPGPAATQLCGRADLRRAGRRRFAGDSSHRASVLARRRICHAGRLCPRAAGGRCRRPNRNGVRFLRRIGPRSRFENCGCWRRVWSRKPAC